MVKIYISDVSSLEDEDKYENGILVSSRYRTEKAKALRNAPDKARCIGAGLLLSHALSEYFCGDLQKSMHPVNGLWKYIEEAADEKGRPFLKWNEGRDIAGFSGDSKKELPFISISHSGEFAAAAISDRRIGMDIQNKRKITEPVAKRIMSPSELSHAMALKEEDRQRYALCLWTEKEAAAKLDGRGIFEMLPQLSDDDWQERLGIKCITKEPIQDVFLSFAVYK